VDVDETEEDEEVEQPKPVKRRTSKTFKDMPKQPPSAYDLFFRHEQEKLTSNGEDGHLKTKTSSPQTFQQRGLNNRNKPQRPINHQRRRNKARPKIGFAGLARISTKWSEIDSESKQIFINEAEREKQRYKVALAKWKEANTMDSSSQKPNHSNDAASMHLVGSDIQQEAVRLSPIQHILLDHSNAVEARAPAPAPVFNKSSRDSLSTAMPHRVPTPAGKAQPSRRERQPPHGVVFFPRLWPESGPLAAFFNDPSLQQTFLPP
jgi:hypothetical protein